MWGIRSEQFDNDQGLRFIVDLGTRPATVQEVLIAWREDGAFRTLFNDSLAGSQFSAFRWETPPVTAATLAQPFEFVLLDSPGLARRPDAQAFAEHFGSAKDSEVVVFSNLGNDAIMVVPCPIAVPSAYGHLAAFVREAPEQQRQCSVAVSRRGNGAACGRASRCGSARQGPVFRGCT
jgi:hypothetical protein